MPQIELAVNRSQPFELAHHCRYHKRYCGIFNDLRFFMDVFMDMGADVWDLPSAAQSF